jgi:hypothetical protein
VATLCTNLLVQPEEIVGRSLKLFNQVLVVFITKELKKKYPDDWFQQAVNTLNRPLSNKTGSNMSLYTSFDTGNLIQIIINLWNPVFQDTELTCVAAMYLFLIVKTTKVCCSSLRGPGMIGLTNLVFLWKYVVSFYENIYLLILGCVPYFR